MRRTSFSRLSSAQNAGGKVITYAPDSAGRTLSAVDSGSGINYVTSAMYGPDLALALHQL